MHAIKFVKVTKLNIKMMMSSLINDSNVIHWSFINQLLACFLYNVFPFDCVV